MKKVYRYFEKNGYIGRWTSYNYTDDWGAWCKYREEREVADDIPILEFYAEEEHTNVCRCINCGGGQYCHYKNSDPLVELLTDLYGIPHEGRHRLTFFAGDYVVKYPKSSWGAAVNRSEAYDTFDFPTAKCWIEEVGSVELLWMEKVSRVNPYASYLPEWANAIDAAQVGVNKKGELVAYDFGKEPSY